MAENEHKALLDQMERELEQTIEPEKQEGLLYHYTDAAALLGIVKYKKIWATHYAHLNDSQELRSGEAIVNDVATELLKEVPAGSPHAWFFEAFLHVHPKHGLRQIADIFVASLSVEGNLLSQWRGYAGGGTGYSIGFSGFKLPPPGERPEANLALELIRCEYDEAAFRQKCRPVLTKIAAGFELYAKTYAHAGERLSHLALTVALRHVAPLVLRFKHPAFKEEKEWRLVAFPLPNGQELVQYRAGKTGIVPYLPIDLADADMPLQLGKIYVGPRQDPDAGVCAARDLLKAHGYDGHALVEHSGIPFRG